jgi:hypothetical protein
MMQSQACWPRPCRRVAPTARKRRLLLLLVPPPPRASPLPRGQAVSQPWACRSPQLAGTMRRARPCPAKVRRGARRRAACLLATIKTPNMRHGEKARLHLLEMKCPSERKRLCWLAMIRARLAPCSAQSAPATPWRCHRACPGRQWCVLYTWLLARCPSLCLCGPACAVSQAPSAQVKFPLTRYDLSPIPRIPGTTATTATTAMYRASRSSTGRRPCGPGLPKAARTRTFPPPLRTGT